MKAEDNVICLEQIRQKKEIQQPKPYKQKLLCDEIAQVELPNHIRKIQSKTMSLYEYFAPVKNGEVRVRLTSNCSEEELRGERHVLRVRVVQRSYQNRLDEILVYMYPQEMSLDTSKFMTIESGFASARVNRKIIPLLFPLVGTIVFTDESYSAEIIPMFSRREGE